MITVCITNFKRSQRLKNCVDSVLKIPEIKHIVISTFCPEESQEALNIYSAVRNDCASKNVDLKWVISETDHGCNNLWIQAVAWAKTPWCILLHDDDTLIEPAFRQFMPEILTALENGYGSFAMWNGVTSHDSGLRQDHYSLPTSTRPGSNDTSLIVKILLKRGAFSISPVVGLFRPKDIMSVLLECAGSFEGNSKFFSRPNMMVGNDMLIWLRIAEKYSKFIYSSAHMTGYGHWEGSTTVSQGRQLVPCYAATQEHYSHVRAENTVSKPLLVHVTNFYQVEGDRESERRQLFAASRWHELMGDPIISVEIPDDTLRLSSIMGDERPSPFARDIINCGMRFAVNPDQDIICFTNSDISPSADLYKRLTARIKLTGGCAYSYRRDFYSKLDEPKTASEIAGAKHYMGTDLFAMTPAWWAKHGGCLPDFILGREAWDWVFRTIMDTASGSKAGFDDLIYHEKHPSFWENPSNRGVNVGNKWNRSLAKNFFESRLGYVGQFDQGVVVKPHQINITPAYLETT